MPVKLNLLLFNEKVMHQRQGTVKLHRGRKGRIQRSFLKHDPSVCPPHVQSDRSLPGCGSSMWVAGDVWREPPGWGRGWTGAGKEREGGLKCTGDITFKVQRNGEDSFRTTSSPPTLPLIHPSIHPPTHPSVQSLTDWKQNAEKA